MSSARLATAAIQAGLFTLGSPIVVGLVRKIRAVLEGRQGPPVTQPLRDVWKLMGKERIAPEHASWVFPAAPLVVLGTAFVVVASAPFISLRSPVPSASDLFVVVSLLLLGTVALALAGLDPGTAFGGMGSSREMTVAAIAEPTLLLSAFALSIPAGSTSLQAVVGAGLERPEALAAPPAILAFVAFAIAILAEGGRLPVDNPATHLELTMIHEGMVLEYAGPDLAFVELGAAMRLTIFLGLLSNLFFPWGISTAGEPASLAIGAVVLAGKVGLLACALGVFEVFNAKLRLFRVPELLALSLVLAFLSVTAAFFLR